MAGRGHDGGGNLRWLLTYADMITLLLAFFIILYATSKTDSQKYQQLVEAIRYAFGIKASTSRIADTGLGGEKPLLAPDLMTQLQEEITKSLEPEIQQGGVQVEKTEKGIVLRFQDAIFFELGRADLTEEARGILGKVAPILKRIENPIEVEGHTDSLPIRSPLFPSNWELSTARATAVIRHLIGVYGVSPLRLTARGFGEYKPLVPNDPVRGAPQNRRVEIHILRQP